MKKGNLNGSLDVVLVIPLGFKPKTFRTGSCHSIPLSTPLFMGIFGNHQMRICVDFAAIRHCYYSLVGCKGTKKKSNNANLKC